MAIEMVYIKYLAGRVVPESETPSKGKKAASKKAPVEVETEVK